MFHFSGDFYEQGRREWRFRFKKNVGVFLCSFGVGWGVGGLSVVCLRRGVVIVGSLCVWVVMVSVRGAAPATHSLGGRALFCLGFVVEVSGLRACCVNIEAPTRSGRQRVGAFPRESE